MKCRRPHDLLLLLAAAIVAVAAWACGGGRGTDAAIGDPEPVVPDTLRVATLYSPLSFFIYRDEKMGYDYGMLQAIAGSHGFEVALDVAPSLSTAVEWLDSGRVDLIATAVPVTSEYRGRLVPCGETSVTRQVLVQPRNGERITDVTQLVGRDVYVERNSKYHQRLENLDAELGGGIRIHPIDRDTLITEDLIEMVADGRIPLTIVDSDIARLNRTYYPGLDIGLEVSLDQRAAWGVAPGREWLGDSITLWASQASPKRARADLLKRYFELSKSEPTVFNIDFSQGVISPLDPLFRSQASDSWDWRLLAAQAFIESRFDSTLVSWAGARGIMQVMPATARAFGVDASHLADNRTSIGLALKIIGRLEKSLAPKVPDPAERRKFVLAAYNSGIAHILDAIALAGVTGHDPTKWDGNVETALLLKSNPEYFNNPVCRYGYFRGRETTQYVRSVTDFYERAKRFVKL